MKKWIIISCLLWATVAQAQSPGGKVEYTGGQTQLQRLIFMYLSAHNGIYNDPIQTDSLRKSNKYFNCLFQVDKDGVVGQELFVHGFNDTSNIAALVAAIRLSSKKWINHTGNTQWVSLPVYFIHKMPDVADEQVPLINTSILYGAAGKQSIIYLEPIEILMGATMK